MKKRLKSIMVLTLACAMLITGCGKNNEENVPTDTTVEESRLSIKDPTITQYEVGAVINVNDIISISEEDAGNLVNVVFMDGTNVSTEYTVVLGENTVPIIAEFADGTQSDIQWTYTGVESESKLPEDVKAIFNNAEEVHNCAGLSYVCLEGWTCSDTSDMPTVINGVEVESIQFTNSSDSSNIASIAISNNSDVEESINTSKLAVNTVLSSLITECTDEATLSAVLSDEEKEELFSNLLSTIVDTTISTMPLNVSGMTVYGTDGTEYTSDVDTIVIDLSALFAGTDKAIAAYYQVVDFNGNEYCITYTVKKEEVTDTSDEATLNYPAIKVDESILTEEGLRNHLTKIGEELQKANETEASVMKETLASISTEKPDNFDILTNYVIYGEYEVPNTETPVESESTNESTVEISEELETSEVNEAVEVKSTYASKYPDIYKWPENNVKYRRYHHVIEGDTQFNQTIINPDGTYIHSGAEHDAYNPSTGTVGDTSENNAQSYDLVSDYGTYTFSNDTLTDVRFDTVKSNPKHLELTYLGDRYYIEITTATDVQILSKESCLYDTRTFKDGLFEVSVAAAGKKNTEFGTIVPYNIKYTSKDTGKVVESSYMAVYNISNVYLMIYSDNMPQGSEFTLLLNGLMKQVK